MYIALLTAKNYVADLFSREDGQAAPEYVMIIGFISLAIVVAFMLGDVTGAISSMVVKVANTINGVS